MVNSDSDYEEDSFCVASDEVSYETNDVTMEPSATQIYKEENQYGRLRTRREKVVVVI